MKTEVTLTSCDLAIAINDFIKKHHNEIHDVGKYDWEYKVEGEMHSLPFDQVSLVVKDEYPDLMEETT